MSDERLTVEEALRRLESYGSELHMGLGAAFRWAKDLASLRAAIDEDYIRREDVRSMLIEASQRGLAQRWASSGEDHPAVADAVLAEYEAHHE